MRYTHCLWIPFISLIGLSSAFTLHDHSTALLQARQIRYTNYSGPLVPSYNISIPVDHFNDSDTRTYNNRYWVNDTWYQPGGPLIFYDWGEAGVSNETAAQNLAEINMTSAAMELAKKYHGVAVLWEHRYYGLSYPIPLNVTTNEPEGGLEGFKYHTIEQAMEDVVYFANNWQPEGCVDDECDAWSPSKTPWVWIGGSYPGDRGAIMRIRNPEIFYAVWSSSAPVESRADGSAYFDGIAAALPSNCSADVRAAVQLADEIMSGSLGDENLADLKRLATATSQLSFGLNRSYDVSGADGMDVQNIAQVMANAFTTDFQSVGPSNSTDLFCTFLESYNPNGTPTNDTDPWLAILTNPADGTISDEGLVSTYNSSVALVAYFYARRRWLDLYLNVLVKDQVKLPIAIAPDFQADQLSWIYQTLIEFGWYQGSNPENVTILSKYYNYTSIRDNLSVRFGDNVSIEDFPAQPDTEVINKYGGWNMTPSNVMFTNAEFDPWRAGSVASISTEIGAPLRNTTSTIPGCNQPPEGTDVFGIIYPGQVHIKDLMQWVWLPFDESSPVYNGLQLFSKALDVWLPCFNATDQA